MQTKSSLRPDGILCEPDVFGNHVVLSKESLGVVSNLTFDGAAE